MPKGQQATICAASLALPLYVDIQHVECMQAKMHKQASKYRHSKLTLGKGLPPLLASAFGLSSSCFCAWKGTRTHQQLCWCRPGLHHFCEG